MRYASNDEFKPPGRTDAGSMPHFRQYAGCSPSCSINQRTHEASLKKGTVHVSQYQSLGATCTCTKRELCWMTRKRTATRVISLGFADLNGPITAKQISLNAEASHFHGVCCQRTICHRRRQHSSSDVIKSGCWPCAMGRFVQRQ